MPPTPERTSRWLGLLMPLLERGGAVVSLVLLLLGAVQVYWLLGALGRAQGINRELVERLLAAHKEHLAFVVAANATHVELALKVAHCPPQP